MIFISYSHTDAKDEALRFRRTLEGITGEDVWIDDKGIEIGEYWDTEIRKNLSKCEMACLLVSPSLLGEDDSGYVWQQEIRELEEHGVPIAFLMVKNILPAGNITRWATNMQRLGDRRAVLGQRQWIRDPKLGVLPENEAEYVAAMEEVAEKINHTLDKRREDAEKAALQRAQDTRFENVPRSDCLFIDDDGRVFGVVEPKDLTIQFEFSPQRSWNLSVITTAFKHARVVISPPGDLLVLQEMNEGPDEDRGQGCSALLCRLDGNTPEIFELSFPEDCGMISSAWIGGDGRRFRFTLSSGVEWSFDSRTRELGRVGKGALERGTEMVRIMLDGYVSSTWITSKPERSLESDGFAQLYEGLGNPENSNWRSLDLAIHENQILIGGVRKDGEVHVGLGTPTNEGKVKWTRRESLEAPREFEIESIAIGRLVAKAGAFTEFLISGSGRSWLCSLDSPLK